MELCYLFFNIQPEDNRKLARIFIRSTHLSSNFYETVPLFENQYNVKIYMCFNGSGVFTTTLDNLDIIYNTIDNDKFYIEPINFIYKHNKFQPLQLQDLCIKNIVAQCSIFHEIVRFKPNLPKFLYHKLIRKGMCYIQIPKRGLGFTKFNNFMRKRYIDNPNVEIEDFEETVIPKCDIDDFQHQMFNYLLNNHLKVIISTFRCKDNTERSKLYRMCLKCMELYLETDKSIIYVEKFRSFHKYLCLETDEYFYKGMDYEYWYEPGNEAWHKFSYECWCESCKQVPLFKTIHDNNVSKTIHDNNVSKTIHCNTITSFLEKNRLRIPLQLVRDSTVQLYPKLQW